MGKPTVKTISANKKKTSQNVITKKFKDQIKKLLETKVSDDKATTKKKKKIEKDEPTTSKLVDKKISETKNSIQKNVVKENKPKNSKIVVAKKVTKDVKNKKEQTNGKSKPQQQQPPSNKNKKESSQSKSKNVLTEKKSSNSHNGKEKAKTKPEKNNQKSSSKSNLNTNVKKVSKVVPKNTSSETKKLTNGNSKKTVIKQVDGKKKKKLTKTVKDNENIKLKNNSKAVENESENVKKVKSATTKKKSVEKVTAKKKKPIKIHKSATSVTSSNSSNTKKIEVKKTKVENGTKSKATNNKVEMKSESGLKRKAIPKKSKDSKRSKCDGPSSKKSSVASKAKKEKLKENIKTKADMEHQKAINIIKEVICEDNKNFGLNASDDDSDASSYIDQFFDADVDGGSEENSESCSDSDDDMSEDESNSEVDNEIDMSLDQLIKQYGNSDNSNDEKQLVDYVNNGLDEESYDEEEDEDFECDILTTESENEDSDETDDDDEDGGINPGTGNMEYDSENSDHNEDDEWEDIEEEIVDPKSLKKYSNHNNKYSDSSDSEYSNLDDSDYSDSEDEDHYNFDTDSNDTDYTPGEDYIDDLVINRGDANIYDVDYNISFDSDSPQIFEINNGIEEEEDEKASLTSEDSCPQLIKIDNCKPINKSPTIVRSAGNLADTDMFENDNETIGGTEYKDFSKYNEEETYRDDFTVTTVDMSEFSKEDDRESYAKFSDSDVLEEVFSADDTNSEESFESESFDEQDYFVDDDTDVEEMDPEKLKCYKGINCQNVLLHVSERIIIHGCLKIKLLAGSVEILGYTMKLNETKEMYSPRGNTFLCITPMEPEFFNRIVINEQINKLKNIFLDEDLDEIRNNFNPITDSLLLAEELIGNKKIAMIKKYMKQKVFPTINDVHVDRPYYTCEFLLKTLFYTNYQRKLIYNLEWENIVLNKNTKLLLTGGKSVGKSTLLRYLINKNINDYKRILLIDLDIGQTEVFVPETVSVTVIDQPLLGPGYLHKLKPDKSFLYGDFSINSCPIKYIKCVYNLLNFCKQNPEYQNMPWLVNTMGYTKGFGMEIISTIIKLLSPTDLVQIQNVTRKIENFADDLTAEFVNQMNFNILLTEMKEIYKEKKEIQKYNLIKISSMIKKRKDVSGWEISSLDLRTIYILSYLGNILNKSNSDWFTDVKPICGSLKSLNIHMTSNIEVSPEFLINVLNSNIVFLCNKVDGKNGNDDLSLECFGIGIVRGVDKVGDKIYLLAPFEIDQMVKVNTLAIGTTPIPSTIILIQNPNVKGKIPYVYNGKSFVGTKHVQNFFKTTDIQISA